MKYGFLHTAAVSPALHVADCAYNTQQIIAAMRKSLPAFKAPRDIAVLNDWPLTSSGKVDYMELKRRWPDAKERLR